MVPNGIVAATEAGGELRLSAAFEDYFDRAPSASQWSWDAALYNPIPSEGVLPVFSSAGAWMRSTSTFSQKVLEGRISFGVGPNEAFGWGDEGLVSDFALLITSGKGRVYASTMADGGKVTQTPLNGLDPGGFHNVRIVWGPASVQYWIDGSMLAEHTSAPSVPLYVSLSNSAAAGTMMVDWVRVNSYQPGSSTYLSSIKDAEKMVGWGALVWAGERPSGTDIAFETRSSTELDIWTEEWSSLDGDGAIASPAGRYLQYRVTLSTGSGSVSPRVDEVSYTRELETPTPTPSPTQTSTPTTDLDTPTPTALPTQTSVPTQVSTPTQTATPTPTVTPTPTLLATPTEPPSPTPDVMTTPTSTPAPTATPKKTRRPKDAVPTGATEAASPEGNESTGSQPTATPTATSTATPQAAVAPVVGASEVLIASGSDGLGTTATGASTLSATGGTGSGRPESGGRGLLAVEDAIVLAFGGMIFLPAIARRPRSSQRKDRDAGRQA